MRALFFILVGIALTFGAIHYMGPDRFMKLYQGIMSTGQEIAGGGGIDTITEKLNNGPKTSSPAPGNASPDQGSSVVKTPPQGEPAQP
jgi:hypothetical protein